MSQIRSLAIQVGLRPGKQSKTALVRALQRQEGNFDCFATAVHGDCDQALCCWRQDCLNLAPRRAG
ncbi:MAG: SAP domain-containing protein [Chromatiales bacterium]